MHRPPSNASLGSIKKLNFPIQSILLLLGELKTRNGNWIFYWHHLGSIFLLLFSIFLEPKKLSYLALDVLFTPIYTSTSFLVFRDSNPKFLLLQVLNYNEKHWPEGSLTAPGFPVFATCPPGDWKDLSSNAS